MTTMSKSKVLVVGGTGYFGNRLVRASLAQGHPTYVLLRPEILRDIDRVQLLLELKHLGATLIEGSFSDQNSLVEAVRHADVVISAMSGTFFRSHNLLLQLKLVDAIQQAGNVKRFLPSEFGSEAALMGHAMEPMKRTFDEKMAVRKAIEKANIPHTYIISNCSAGYFAGNLCQLETLLPPKHKVSIHGDGNVKVAFVDEDDIARYTIKSVDDPRTLNKTVYLRPPENILSQRELVEKWERLTGRTMEKNTVSAQELLAHLKGADMATKAGIELYYHIFYEGCTMNYEIGEHGEEGSKLYPEIAYTRMHEYLKRYI